MGAVFGGGASDAPASGAAAPAETPEAEPPLTAAAVRWRKIVRHLRRLRRLQRLWGLLGGRIQVYPAALRDRLREIDPPAPHRR